VSRYVRFEEVIYFHRSLEPRVNIEDDTEAQIDVSGGSKASGFWYTRFKGDRVTLHNFRFIVTGGSGSGCRGFKISECWDHV
jgi:hypothetical protein